MDCNKLDPDYKLSIIILWFYGYTYWVSNNLLEKNNYKGIYLIYSTYYILTMRVHQTSDFA